MEGPDTEPVKGSGSGSRQAAVGVFTGAPAAAFLWLSHTDVHKKEYDLL